MLAYIAVAWMALSVDLTLGLPSGLEGITASDASFEERGSNQHNAEPSGSHGPPSPMRHFLLRYKVLLFAVILPSGLLIARIGFYLRMRGEEVIGFLVFIAGGIIGGAGVTLLTLN